MSKLSSIVLIFIILISSFGISIAKEGLIKKEIENIDNIIIDDIKVDEHKVYGCSIKVKKQSDFDMLENDIKRALSNNENVYVEIGPGTYFSKNKHIALNNIQYPDLHLKIQGIGEVIIMGASSDLLQYSESQDNYNVCQLGIDEIIDPKDIYTDGKKIVSLSSKVDGFSKSVMFVDTLFEKIDPQTPKDTHYRLKSSLLPNLSKEDCRNLWLWTTHSWTSSYEKIDSVSNGYIYLTANPKIELSQCPLNTDYKTWKIKPRIKVVNSTPDTKGVYIASDNKMYIPKCYEKLFKCDKETFFRLLKSSIGSVEIAGLKFIGFKEAVIWIDKVENYAYIHDCEFVGQMNDAIFIDSNNSIISNNTFEKSMASVISIPNKGNSHHIIENNIFRECGIGLSTMGCIKIASDSVRVNGNVFRNNYLAAINNGVWYGNPKKGKIFTIFEDNLIYNDSLFLSGYESNSLMDVGLLYTNAKNDMLIIRKNRIHGQRSFAGGSGIYIDDGCNNAKIYGNIVTGIDGKLYNINCRSKIAQKAMDSVPQYSTGNFCYGNIIDGPIRFDIRDDLASKKYPPSLYGGNIFLSKSDFAKPNKISCSDKSLDYYTQDYTTNDLYITLSRNTYDKIFAKYEDIPITKWILVED